MKQTADVVIIGGGVEGCSIAYNLAREGCGNVVLIEKNTLASGSTGKSCGVIRTHYSQELLMKMAHESMSVFGRFEEEFEKESGFVTNGLVFLGTSEETAGLREVTAMQQKLGIRAELVSPDSVPKFHPDVSIEGIDLASYEPDAGFADPYGVTIGFAAGARKAGVEINEGVEATGIEIKRGRIEAVLTSRGRIATENVINAAGPWGKRVGEMAGVDLPLFPIRLQEAVMKPGTDYPHSMPTVFDQRTICYYRPESGGFLVFGGYWGSHDVFAFGAFKGHRFVCDQVDHSDELFAFAHVQLDRNDVQTELLFEFLADAFRIGSGAVHFVDEGDSRYAVTLHLAINCD